MCVLQGHSVELENPVLEEVILAASVPVAVHVTSQNRYGKCEMLCAIRVRDTLLESNSEPVRAKIFKTCKINGQEHVTNQIEALCAAYPVIVLPGCSYARIRDGRQSSGGLG